MGYTVSPKKRLWKIVVPTTTPVLGKYLGVSNLYNLTVTNKEFQL